MDLYYFCLGAACSAVPLAALFLIFKNKFGSILMGSWAVLNLIGMAYYG